MSEQELLDRIVSVCGTGGEALSLSVLCESIGTIGLQEPEIVRTGTSIEECVQKLKESKRGSLVVVNASGKLVGIFTERDCVRKLFCTTPCFQDPIETVMTPDPVREHALATIAFALTLMSHGGFRHLPIVDEDDSPIGILSVKEVMDFLVAKMLEGLVETVDLAG
jgi:CBS domain-containing protein